MCNIVSIVRALIDGSWFDWRVRVLRGGSTVTWTRQLQFERARLRCIVERRTRHIFHHFIFVAVNNVTNTHSEHAWLNEWSTREDKTTVFVSRRFAIWSDACRVASRLMHAFTLAQPFLPRALFFARRFATKHCLSMKSYSYAVFG